MIRGPNGASSRASSWPMLPKPTIPTVSSDSSRPRSGCQVRSRWSSSSCGSRRAVARITITRYSAIGRLNTPRALVTTTPRERASGVATFSTPAETEWIHRRSGAWPSRWSRTEAGIEPRSSTSASASVASGSARSSACTRPSGETRTARTSPSASMRASCSPLSGVPRTGVTSTVSGALRPAPPRRGRSRRWAHGSRRGPATSPGRSRPGSGNPAPARRSPRPRTARRRRTARA